MNRIARFGMLMAVSGVVDAASQPVEFSVMPVAIGDVRLSCQIKVKADHVTQVDYHVKYFDGGGKLLRESDVGWQNIVTGAVQPIEKGKSYTTKDRMPDGTAKAEATLLRVIFKDGKTWAPGH